MTTNRLTTKFQRTAITRPSRNDQTKSRERHANPKCNHSEKINYAKTNGVQSYGRGENEHERPADLTGEERLPTDFQQNHIDHNMTNNDEAIEDVLDEDLDIFYMALAYQDDVLSLSIADVPVRPTKHELLEDQ